MICVTERDDIVDRQMMEACYDAYKSGRNLPHTVRDPKVEGITVEEFIASQRRLMQKSLLSGSVTHTRAGTLYSPTSITEKGIKFVEEPANPIIQRETPNHTKKIIITPEEKLSMMLPSEIEQRCHELVAKNHEHKKFAYPAIGIAVSAIAVLLAIPFVFTGKESDLFLSVGLWSMIGYFAIALAITGILSKKSRPYKITGYEKNVVRVYAAHQFVEKYQKDKLQSLLVSATNEIESLLYDLQNGWGDFSEKNPSFRSLVKPVEDFMNNIDFRLIPVMEKEGNPENVKNVEFSLALMIKFFLSEKFEQITSLNQELEKYPDESSEEETFKEKIRKHKHLVSILMSLAIIIGSGALASSTKLIKQDFAIETQVLIWVGVSVPFTIFWLRSRYKN